MASLEQRVGVWKGERGWRVCFGPPGAEARVSMQEDCLTQVQDERGIVTRYTWNQELGVATQRIDNYLSGQSGPDKNKTTEFEYTADGNLKKLRAKSTTPGDQVTE
ncbi:MAG: hypothetical protein KJ072_00360 [Verrucomicrobia bacterium]|nr:hypothetical protein [Verrucomicrobiota bacterium]